MKKKKEQPILHDVAITDIGAEGMAVARVDGMVLFVPYAAPGDIADVRLVKKKKSYAEGRLESVTTPSPLRCEVRCQHFGVCGGCRWQHVEYSAQLAAKQQQVRDNLERLGHIDCNGMQPICGSENIYCYRNKLEFTFSTRMWHTMPPSADSPAEPGALGFHIPQLFDKVLNIEQCHLQPEPSNQIRLAVRDYAIEHNLPFYDIRNHTGCLRNLIIRNTSNNQWMVVLVVADTEHDWQGLLEHLRVSFPQITSLQYIVNQKFNDSYSDLPATVYSGQDHVEETMPSPDGGEPLRFYIRPQTFYQTNSAQAYRLYSYVAQYAQLSPSDVLYDLYTGTGTIALFLARQCSRVVGIEYVEDSVVAARQNAQLNGIGNAEFHAGDMAKVLTPEFVAAHGQPDVVVTDPPRAGMHEKVVEQLLSMRPRRIIYVSCNPATQARDLQMLSTAYSVGRIQPVDMFPHTQHIENIAELILREE